jgi:hypothetical protein
MSRWREQQGEHPPPRTPGRVTIYGWSTRMPTRDDTDMDATRASRIGKPLLALLVRSFSTTSRPACGRPPQAAVLGRQPPVPLASRLSCVACGESRL